VLVARGHGNPRNPQIARELVITPRTASRHVEHVMPRLGVHSRAEIGARAAPRGRLGAAVGQAVPGRAGPTGCITSRDRSRPCRPSLGAGNGRGPRPRPGAPPRRVRQTRRRVEGSAHLPPVRGRCYTGLRTAVLAS
jgi:hypothetical protein